MTVRIERPRRRLHLHIYGLPVAQGRPRAVRTPRGIHVYDPPASRDWKRTVQGQLLPHRPPIPLDGPLGVILIFGLPRPKSLPKKIRCPTTRPDIENLAKAVLDAMEGVIYRDDAQIVRLSLRKQYSATPGVQILVVDGAPRSEPHTHPGG